MSVYSILFQKGIYCFPVFLLDYIEAGQRICLYVFVLKMHHKFFEQQLSFRHGTKNWKS